MGRVPVDTVDAGNLLLSVQPLPGMQLSGKAAQQPGCDLVRLAPFCYHPAPLGTIARPKSAAFQAGMGTE